MRYFSVIWTVTCGFYLASVSSLYTNSNRDGDWDFKRVLAESSAQKQQEQLAENDDAGRLRKKFNKLDRDRLSQYLTLIAKSAKMAKEAQELEEESSPAEANDDEGKYALRRMALDTSEKRNGALPIVRRQQVCVFKICPPSPWVTNKLI